MISATSTDAAAMARSTQLSPPALCSIAETSRQWGGTGKTLTYDLIKKHGVTIVRVGGRSMVPHSEIMRVVDRLIADSAEPSKPAKGGRVLAASSVEARKARRANSTK